MSTDQIPTNQKNWPINCLWLTKCTYLFDWSSFGQYITFCKIIVTTDQISTVKILVRIGQARKFAYQNRFRPFGENNLLLDTVETALICIVKVMFNQNITYIML